MPSQSDQHALELRHEVFTILHEQLGFFVGLSSEGRLTLKSERVEIFRTEAATSILPIIAAQLPDIEDSVAFISEATIGIADDPARTTLLLECQKVVDEDVVASAGVAVELGEHCHLIITTEDDQICLDNLKLMLLGLPELESVGVSESSSDSLTEARALGLVRFIAERLA